MNRPPDADFSVPVTQEQLEVHRQRVDSNRPRRLRKEVEEEQVQVSEPLAVEAVSVERVPIGRVVDAPPAVRTEGDVTVVPVLEERLVTHKELVLVAEIRLTRRHKVVQATADVPLRRERVVVERFDPDRGQWLPEPGRQDAHSSEEPQQE